MSKQSKIILAIFLIIVSTGSMAKPSFTSKVLISNLNHPWAVVFLSDNKFIISERNSNLLLFDNGNKIILSTKSIKVFAKGQGGLLDLALHPNYKNNGWIYLSYSRYSNKGATTALARFKVKNNKINKLQDIYTANAWSDTSHHFGGAIAFADDGHLYLSVGDRGNRYMAQQTTTDMGKILRLKYNGKIAKNNPFNNAIYSYGHRNPQGLVYYQKQLLEHEHGARGGDEFNIIHSGNNYGWPIASYSREYVSNRVIGVTNKKGTAKPIHYWTPSIAPSGMAIYKNLHNKKSNILIGSLKKSQLHLLQLSGNKISKENILFANKFGRIRNITVHNGVIYLLTDEDRGKLIAISKI